jgi:hypothetical protein
MVLMSMEAISASSWDEARLLDRPLPRLLLNSREGSFRFRNKSLCGNLRINRLPASPQ